MPQINTNIPSSTDHKITLRDVIVLLLVISKNKGWSMWSVKYTKEKNPSQSESI